jgi:simple sugar transport system ATP-binding protein/ribose transport system ATP-binding protein
MTDLLVARGVTKHFGGVQALREVTVTVARGSVHGLVGENGAGKSTLGKIVAGILPPDEGAIFVDGEEMRFRSTRDALLRGRITIVGQERAVIPRLTVLENVFLGREEGSGGMLRSGSLLARYADLIERTGFSLPADVRVGGLRVSEQLQVEILRALVRDAQLIIMDEVTAALTSDEASRLFEVVRSLKAEGRGVLYISHLLGEVITLSDVITVLRDGALVRTGPASDETPASLVAAMVGRTVELSFPDKRFPPADAPVLLSVRNLQQRNVEGVSLDVRAGEIVGLAGLIGSGRSEVARAVFGVDRRSSGTVAVDGTDVEIRRPRDAINAGIALLPESRKEEGLLMRQSITHNVSLVHLREFVTGTLVRPRREKQAVERTITTLDVKAPGVNSLVENLSGGNQQKVLFAKWLFRPPRVLIADEPTRGVDVGAKHAIYELIARLADEGMGVLLISSELEEILGLAHRILVMRLGRIVAEFDGRTATDDLVMRAAFAADEDDTRHDNDTAVRSASVS